MTMNLKEEESLNSNLFFFIFIYTSNCFFSLFVSSLPSLLPFFIYFSYFYSFLSSFSSLTSILSFFFSSFLLFFFSSFLLFFPFNFSSSLFLFLSTDFFHLKNCLQPILTSRKENAAWKEFLKNHLPPPKIRIIKILQKEEEHKA